MDPSAVPGDPGVVPGVPAAVPGVTPEETPWDATYLAAAAEAARAAGSADPTGAELNSSTK